jgi:hypothetical protein
VRLPDAVHTADALLKPHGVPEDIVVDDDMAELQVQPFPTGVGGDEDAGLTAKATWTRWRSSMSMEPLCQVPVQRVGLT